MQKKILVLGALPPPYTGQSISLDKLVETLKTDNDFVVNNINLAPKTNHTTGSLNFSRIYETISVIIKYLLKLIFFKPDVIYITKGSSKWGFIRDYIFEKLRSIFCQKAKFVVHLKGGNYDKFYEQSSCELKKKIRHFLIKSDKVIVLGPSLIKMYDFCPEVKNKIVVVYNALPNQVVSSKIVKDNKKLQILFLSNLILSKGYFDILRSIVLLKDYNIHFHFAGEFMLSPDDEYKNNSVANLREMFFSFIKNKDISDKITYHGVLVDADKYSCLEKMDIFILPTYYHVEGQPISIIEAMACSNAIISTDYRSIPDIVDENSNCIFVEPKNPDSIVAAIKIFYNDREKLKHFQNTSYERYLDFHTWDNHYKSMATIFKEV
ncbi:glycosyltransferase family 4 protein [Citrobacter braakii]